MEFALLNSKFENNAFCWNQVKAKDCGRLDERFISVQNYLKVSTKGHCSLKVNP
jgi:hypothetical protein